VRTRLSLLSLRCGVHWLVSYLFKCNACFGIGSALEVVVALGRGAWRRNLVISILLHLCFISNFVLTAPFGRRAI
jgi:hypothetical protein